MTDGERSDRSARIMPMMFLLTGLLTCSTLVYARLSLLLIATGAVGVGVFWLVRSRGWQKTGEILALAFLTLLPFYLPLKFVLGNPFWFPFLPAAATITFALLFLLPLFAFSHVHLLRIDKWAIAFFLWGLVLIPITALNAEIVAALGVLAVGLAFAHYSPLTSPIMSSGAWYLMALMSREWSASARSKVMARTIVRPVGSAASSAAIGRSGI